MKLIGCMAVRNEAWVLGLSLRVALQWCDEMVVLLHVCTDDSAAIVETIQGEHPGRVIVRTHRHECWTEMAHRQQMLEIARSEGATHIAIVDADEIVTGNLLPDEPLWDIKDTVATVPKGSILQLPLYQLRGSLDRYHANGIWGNRWLSVAFQDDPRLSWSGDKFHDREPRYPDGSQLKPYKPITQGNGGAMHLWGVSERRLRARHALYKCVERLRWPERPVAEIELMYNDWRSPEDNFKHWQIARYREPWTFADVPAEWWEAYVRGDNFEFPIDINSEPWQIAEVKRLVAQHGAETFKGLDLFGVA